MSSILQCVAIVLAHVLFAALGPLPMVLIVWLIAGDTAALWAWGGLVALGVFSVLAFFVIPEMTKKAD